MRTCPHCKGMLIKYGFLKKERTQKYRCKMCRRMCSDADKRTFGTLRSKPETIILVTNLLIEGVGIRGAARVANCHRDTVLRILKHTGQRSYDLLNTKLKDVKASHVEADEIHTFVLKKNRKDIDPEFDTNPWGDYYTFLAMDSESKLLFMPTIGKRSKNKTHCFANELAQSITDRFQLTTDGFRPYKYEMKQAFGSRIDFAQIYKEHHMLNAANKRKRAVHAVRSGNPDRSRITTSHMERGNLTLRIWNKRFNRKTICFSKDEEYLAYSIYLFTASYNFIKPHSALERKTTPAMASGIATNPLTIQQLIANDLE